MYESYEVSKDNIQDLIDVLDGNVRINIYCKDCGEPRIFSMKEVLCPFGNPQEDVSMGSLGKELLRQQQLQEMCSAPLPGEKRPEKEWIWTNCRTQEFTRVMVFQFQCAMDARHYTDYIVRAEGNMLVKIGQFPSIADLTFPELDKYKKVLSSTDRKEFGRALGLYAHGIGAGSYVYLRRIFERLLMQAKEIAGSAINESEFSKAHVDEKITMLSDYLPNMLTSNPTIYGILSKGIHELSEKECITYFPVLKECICMILGEWEEIRKKKEQETALASALSKISSSIK